VKRGGDVLLQSDPSPDTPLAVAETIGRIYGRVQFDVSPTAASPHAATTAAHNARRNSPAVNPLSPSGIGPSLPVW
jgi:hypothetical protein